MRLIGRTEPPQVAILSDLSGSMLTRDVVSTNEIITRSEWLEEQTGREFWKPLETGSEVVVGAFAAPPDLIHQHRRPAEGNRHRPDRRPRSSDRAAKKSPRPC